MEYKIGAKKKATAPLTTKPFKNLLTNQNKKPLITSKKRPRVKIVMGMVKTTKIGLIMLLTKPKITAAIKAEN